MKLPTIPLDGRPNALACDISSFNSLLPNPSFPDQGLDGLTLIDAGTRYWEGEVAAVVRKGR